jgi:outer membrane protein assembly factor BamA
MDGFETQQSWMVALYSDHFFLGGPLNIRGFDSRGVGPHQDGKFFFYSSSNHNLPYVDYCTLNRLCCGIGSCPDPQLVG